MNETSFNNEICLNKKQDDFSKSENFKNQLKDSNDPLPLQREIAPPNPYPFEALGELLGNAARRIHEVVQAPDAVCAQSVLGAASLCTQPFSNVILDGRQYPLSLNSLSVVDSGERKSAADKIAFRPVTEWQKHLVAVTEKEIDQFRNDIEVWEKKRKTALNETNDSKRECAFRNLGDQPDQPIEPLIICNEPTTEGLIRYLQSGQPSFSIFLMKVGD